MFHRVVLAASVLAVLSAACEDIKPAMSGRLKGPAGIALFKGCAQNNPGCDSGADGHHLLVVSNSMDDDLSIFDLENRAFFDAYNPLFPLKIPVGHHPRNLCIDPYGRWAFVVNQLGHDVSLVDLDSKRMVEVDTDANQETTASSLACPENPNQETDPVNDRCLAGISRATLGDAKDPLAEYVVVPKGNPDSEDGQVWPMDVPLPVWVSIPTSGQVALLHFQYPMANAPQTLRFIRTVDLGGMPSGMAITSDGKTLFVADEDSDSISVINLGTLDVERVMVGGPSRRVFLSPDESVLYVVRLDDNRIALVDTTSLERLQAYRGEFDTEADPDADEMDIVLPGIPRDITFAKGHGLKVLGKDSTMQYYPVDEEGSALDDPTQLFAYVSDLNGNIYILDAVRHGNIDMTPILGPSIGNPGYVVDGKVQNEEDLLACVDSSSEKYGANCPYPVIANFDRIYNVESEITGEIEQDPTIYHGIHVSPGITRSEGWILTFEGVLPGTGVSDTGRFYGWRLVDDRQNLSFIESDVHADTDPGDGVADGDILEILTPPAKMDGDDKFDPACIPDGATDVRTEFNITGVDESTLIIQTVDGMDLGLCWPTAIQYKVRARNAWTVLGVRSGPQPRLHMVPWQDSSVEPPAYDNGYIALTIFEPGIDLDGNPIKVKRDSAWGFTTEDGFSNAQFTPSIRAGMAGPMVSVDLDDGADQQDRDSDDPVTGPADDRIYLIFEGSNALMEFFPGNLDSRSYLLYQ